ncbi:hypothetical protein K7X08_011881 [Anisodus acutangulus]|uniref:Uncharacterized protein n=1 Tax=Anisodus acutangulus TaxID=402998 RepID=A0A9Q1L9B6_9SOLA|nr:hypothetical protein K7X08_011881 [Anisodus acutangulus]
MEEKVVGNVNDLYKWQTQSGKKQKNDKVDGQKQLTLHGEKNGAITIATGNPKGKGVDDVVLDVHDDPEVHIGNVTLGDGVVQHVERIVNVANGQLVEDEVPVGVKIIEKPLNPNTMSCQDIPSNTFATNTHTDGVQRRLWSEQKEEAVEEGELACDKIVDQVQSSDSITSSQEINAMFDKVVEEVDGTITSHVAVEVADVVKDVNNTDDVIRIECDVNTKTMVPQNGDNIHKRSPINIRVQICSEEVDKCPANLQDELNNNAADQRVDSSGEMTPGNDVQKHGKPPNALQLVIDYQNSVNK